jgi:hypothetical protein
MNTTSPYNDTNPMWLLKYNDDSMWSFAEVRADLVTRGVIEYLGSWFTSFFGYDGYAYNYVNNIPQAAELLLEAEEAAAAAAAAAANSTASSNSTAPVAPVVAPTGSDALGASDNSTDSSNSTASSNSTILSNYTLGDIPAGLEEIVLWIQNNVEGIYETRGKGHQCKKNHRDHHRNETNGSGHGHGHGNWTFGNGTSDISGNSTQNATAPIDLGNSTIAP